MNLFLAHLRCVFQAKWISVWINRGVHDNQILIPEFIYQNVSYSYSVATDHPANPQYLIVGYGMGWFCTSYRGHNVSAEYLDLTCLMINRLQVVYHSGDIPGLSTLVSFLPSDEIGVTLFANGEGKAEQQMLILNHILDSALHLTGSSTQTSARFAPFFEPSAQLMMV